MVVLHCSATCWADQPSQVTQVLSSAKVPSDVRLGALKTLNDHFPFVVPDNPGQWESRSRSLKQRILVSTGLWPLPERAPLEATIFGKIQREGFTIEKVFFESLPGHFVTGLLFRPAKFTTAKVPSTKVPAVLCPHGHGGRNFRYSDKEIDDQIKIGAEHFRDSGQTPKLARCATLARMGCVSFIFDMLGYADSVQISHALAHRHQGQRPEEIGDEEDWVFYSCQADLRLQSIMGLQTWNAIRALDFLESLPEVDSNRLAVTGGSGGGTQSILLGAIDDRVKVSFPNGMVSTSMQGGCYCENCNLLRVGTGNVELAALFAPRPQAMTAADDWTKDMMSDGYPELKWLYAMIGDENDVYCRPMLHFKHNYNYVTRATMYQWMNRHLELGLDDPVVEQDFEPLSETDLTVWDDQHPAPPETGIAHEKKVCRWFDEQASKRLIASVPTDRDSFDRFNEVYGAAWRVIFDAPFPAEVTSELVGTSTVDGMTIEKSLLRDPQRGAELPLLTIQGAADADEVVVWSDPVGKAAALDESGKPSAVMRSLLESGATVMIADLLGQGEFNQDGGVLEKQRLIDDSRSYSAFTFGYNRCLTSQRCADLLSVVSHAASRSPTRIRLFGSAGSAGWVVPTGAIAGETVDEFEIVTAGFRYANVKHYSDAGFVPGAVKYGDLPTLMALRAPHRMTVIGDGELSDIVVQAYRATGAAEQLGWKEANDSSSIDAQP